MLRLPPPLSSLRERLRTIAAAVGETRDRVIETQASLSAQIADLRATVEAQAGRDAQRLLAITDGAAARRERLWSLRAAPGYAAPFEDPRPLISVVIPTYENHRLLGERAIPSVLAQTYTNFEVVVVGDAAPAATRRVVESFGDPRVRFHNLPYRGPYPDHPESAWLVAGVPPYNEAVRLARGSWIAPLDDDDAFRPDHLERLLAVAQREHLELAYGRVAIHHPDGSTAERGRFPPEAGQAALQMALYHAGLGPIFPLELTDALYGIPSDWGLFRRMLDAGVRVGMIDDLVVDGWPSTLWTPPEWEHVPEGWARAAAGWDVEEVAAAYALRWPAFLAAIAGSGPLGVGHEVAEGAEIGRESLVDQNAHLCLAMAISSTAGERRSISVLDWGGGLGHHHEVARALLPELELDYHVRELGAVVREGRRLNPVVSFDDADGCLERTYDLVVASSSLQYAERWTELLGTRTGGPLRRVAGWVRAGRVGAR